MNIVITGGTGGIGGAFVEALSRRPLVKQIIATGSRTTGGTVHPGVTWQRLDLTDETAVSDWAGMLHNVAVDALRPGTTDTALSRPFQRHVQPQHLFSPSQSVGYLLEVLDGLVPGQSGRFLAFDGEVLSW